MGSALRFGSKMENDAEETFSPMLLEDSPPPDETKKRAWPCRLQIPIGILIVGLLVGGGVLCFLSLADSKDVERVKAGNIFHFVGDFQERNRRHLLSSGVQAPSSHTPGCTIEQATDYYGWDLEGGSKIKVTANQQECADYSASTPGSRFWTWSKTTKKCYPKSSKAGRRGAGIELVSGNNRCANSGCGNDWEAYDGHCYYWSNNTKTWDEAEAFCQEENGQLASITSNAINQYVVEGMNSRGLSNTWMGGTDIDEEGTWKWRDGSPFKFTFWHSGEPNNSGGNQHCMNQWKHGQGIKWDDRRCSSSLTFLCSKKKSAARSRDP